MCAKYVALFLLHKLFIIQTINCQCLIEGLLAQSKKKLFVTINARYRNKMGRKRVIGEGTKIRESP